ncbi:tRNA pseudouridine(38-40) synthase TruA [Hymenobacter convexus]|uniref:tRNA pseudouridine(38-40) synthase TruA n=1 Tax=Hymenobacter sp. CA1UV-4 TaxID=3063782 RepID=UPI002712F4CC|nr:tRNA pseudouridine(38-40) synthase TruA [Hymenobacter sp. CA1UV-4]MDO7850964.1 tRNA pseudouridine(38-40) synthase TruA [Hymenobacter sp. CA1UV-4]
MRYFLHLAYDGTSYCGWQIQPGMPTVQAELDRCLSQVLRHPTYCLGSGRTDSGVHASHQVAHFDAELPATLSLDQLLYRLRRALPPDIAALRLHPVPDEAHARFSAEERNYEYFVVTQPDPFRRDHALYVDRPLDVAAMNEAAGYLVGQFDFTTFSKVKGGENHYVCYCTAAGWHPAPGGWRFHIRANRFVRGMVRLVVGTLLDVGRGKLTPRQFQALLWAQKRVDAGNAAPARGLFLSRVEYEDGMVPEPE